MTREAYLNCVNDCMKWIQNQMLTFNNGYNGVYERIRINENIRMNWVRPDCNAEIAKVLALYQKITSDHRYDELFHNLSGWVMRAQDNDPLSVWYGSFPFFLVDGHIQQNTLGLNGGNTIYQNDNGKVLIALLELYEMLDDAQYLDRAIKLADYWVGIQCEEGYFFRRDGKTWSSAQGPCFVSWLTSGLIKCYKITGEEKYKVCCYKALKYLVSNILENGRVRTSYEIEKTEDWRPVSSEAGTVLYALSEIYHITGDQYVLDFLNKVGEFVLSLQHKSGGITNCNDDCMDASLQNNQHLCDLVYTQGYTLLALIKAWKVTDKHEYYEAATLLAAFLVKIQCRNESPLWDGAWRGSFDLNTWSWSGRANQNNTYDEGGMYSIYTGWCAAPIMYGLLLLAEAH